MTDTAAPAAPSVYPVLRYRDPAAALAWPETTFDLKESFVARDPGGMIVHAQLAWGPGVIMLGPHDGPDWLPTGPVSVYLACEDPDAHHARAAGAGAEIVMAPTDQEYGSREYCARDPEGHIWSFGTYRPSAN